MRWCVVCWWWMVAYLLRPGPSILDSTRNCVCAACYMHGLWGSSSRATHRVSYPEYRHTLRELGVGQSRLDLDLLIASADRDGEGRIECVVCLVCVVLWVWRVVRMIWHVFRGE